MLVTAAHVLDGFRDGRSLEPGADLFTAFLGEAAGAAPVTDWKLAGLRDDSSSFLAKKGVELLRANMTEEGPLRWSQYKPRQLEAGRAD